MAVQQASTHFANPENLLSLLGLFQLFSYPLQYGYAYVGRVVAVGAAGSAERMEQHVLPASHIKAIIGKRVAFFGQKALDHSPPCQ